MEYEKLLELLKTVSESNITGLHYETGDTKIVISTVESGLAGICVPSVGNAQVAFGTGKVQEVQTDSQPIADAVCQSGNIVKSPLVGTFYTAPSEEAEPFVNVGDKVKKGQTLAIVEAMKLMNDIESDYDGTVIEVFVKNGDCVEYGQPLFAIG